MTVELLLDAKAKLGEGALWDEREGLLYWLDITDGKLHRYHPAISENQTFNIGQYTGAVVLRESGGLILAVKDGFAACNLETGALTMINAVESHLPGNRFNDGKIDPGGRFWAGTMALDMSPGHGSLYRLDTDGSVKKMRQNISISNGIVWTQDHKTMYYIDSIPRTITAFDYDVTTGEISNERLAIHVPDDMGYPDGMAIDSEDMLWVAHYAYGAVVRWNPSTAKVLQEIKLPCRRVTSCAFGGENLDQLYITTSWENASENERQREPLAGGLFLAQPGVIGQISYRYRG